MSAIQTTVHEAGNTTDCDNQTIIKLNNDDLEDGEIDDSDDDENDKVNHTHNAIIASDKVEYQRQEQCEKCSNVETIDLSSNNASPSPQQVARSKNPTLIDDDHANSIQNALANVLKKKGIEPALPKVLENRLQQLHQDSGCSASGFDEASVSQSQSRSNRRRKRKKQREEKEQREKDKSRNKDKKTVQTTLTALLLPSDNDDVDDYELLNVRGGSPPPNTNLSLTTPVMSSTGPLFYENNNEDDDYQSDEDTDASSYDTYNSEDDGNPNEKRRRRRQKREARKRREHRNREDTALISSSLRRQEKRARRESLDEKHRNEPRKLELCKFYLMECCAKKDKCSYMHSDFPCKYYYLGMDCVYKDDCKFAHSEPLSEELRNILLKHLETAPKEILGSFKRISRENAVSMITKRHEELCVKFNVQNIWAPFNANSLPQHSNRRSNNNSNKGLNDSQYQVQQSTNSTTTNNIPSLLDLVIKPPINMDLNCSNNSGNNISNDTIGGKNTSNADKQRKSRWTDNNTNTKGTISVEPSSKAPCYLELKNLTSILSSEHIKKLLSMGINNLEQVNQLTFGQLNQIGLTIAEISEIQVKAMNVDKAGNNNTIGTLCASTAAATEGISLIRDTKYLGGKSSNITGNNRADCLIDSITAPSTNTSGDVDMRFLPSITETLDKIQRPITSNKPSNNNNINADGDCVTTPTTRSIGSERAKTIGLNNVPENEKDNLNSHSNSNSNSSCGVVMVDYSQYLKDSHISFDRSDIFDDEKDDEQLVIDDPNLEHEESPTHVSTPNVIYDMEQKPSETYNTAFASKFPQATDIGKALLNPFNNPCSFYKQNEIKISSDSIKSNIRDVDYYYNDNEDEASYFNNDRQQRKNSRGSPPRSRSRSQTPPLRSQSSTPEASQSPKPFNHMRFESKEIVYERPSMYDYCVRIVEEDEAKAALRLKTDRDMRFLPSSESTSGLSDIDLRLPFQPITNYTPATEIDGSITSHLPMTYKVYEVDVTRPSYLELRQQFKSDHTSDPRLRRILGLPELSPTKTTVALSRKVRKSSHCSSIASPSESEDASPKYYTPPQSQHLTSNVITTTGTIANVGSSFTQQVRGDPRRNLAPSSTGGGDPRRNLSIVSKTNSPNSSGSSIITSDVIVIPPNSSGGQKQNVEIRNLLQKSEWYKNLNSKFKIMVNQQLALVSTELKKFHQNPSPNKIFDISFIVNNSTLQQILTNLGIYIDDNGEVAYVESEGDIGGEKEELQVRNSTKINSITLPNLSQPPPNALGGSSTVASAPSTCSVGGIGNAGTNATLEFLKAPPPNIMAAAPPSITLGPMFQRPPALQVPLFGRPSLLGLPPPTHFNPFTANIAELNAAPNANFLGPNAAANLLGAAFANLPATLQQQQQRNFTTPRNQRNRRLI